MSFQAFPKPPHTRVTLSVIISFAMMIVVLLSGGLAIAIPTSTTASPVNVLTNGSFEHGFTSQPGCGMVGYGWNCFTNGGAAGYGFYDDQWQPVVADGGHSQLIEINTKGMMQGDPDRYAGIYQTVQVTEWEDYTLNVRGMIRTTRHEGDPWRYRVEVGYTPGRHADWRAVTNWRDVGWNTYYDRLEPGSFSDYSTRFTAKDDFVTIYIRVWKKWGAPEEEIDINLDAISLAGPSSYSSAPEKSAAPEGTATPAQAEAAASPVETAAATPVTELVCRNGNDLYNGGFEQGFNPIYAGRVGRSWGFFTNGGAADYGFYDEQWPPVVASGEHGQLIELNTKGMLEGDANRYAGIYQHIRGLTPGKTYELSLKGMLRGERGGEDPHRFEAQWGYNVGHDGDWTHVENWQGMDLGQIYPRIEPGELESYSVRFEAPSTDMVLFLRGWMKWGVGESEFDLNFDDIALSGCQQVVKSAPAATAFDSLRPDSSAQPADAVDNDAAQTSACTYTIKPADMLSLIAADYGVTVVTLMQLNGITDPNLIQIGQVVQIPGCGQPAKAAPESAVAQPVDPPVADDADAAEPPAQPEPTEPESVESPAQTIHVVAPGDTLGAIAQRYGVELSAVVSLNSIANPSLIVVGQQIVIP